MDHSSAPGSLQPLPRSPAGLRVNGAAAGHNVATVPVSSLLPGESPRSAGEDQAHIARLADAEGPLPPVLVDRRTMRVIDGMHRLMAALLQGRQSIEVEFFDGSAADAFLRAVEANVAHGLPLSQADRQMAAARIIESHPHLSDRAVAQTAGLGARTVATLRQRLTDALPQLNARVGRDGKVRPLSGVAGRRRVAELLALHPDASLRAVARDAGVSPATAHDVRKRLERGEEPVPPGRGADGHAGRPGAVGHGTRPAARQHKPEAQPAPAFVLEKLLRDPSLRHNEQGRWLLRWLQRGGVVGGDRPGVVAAVPPHCAALVAQLARQNAQLWQDFATELEERARVIDPWAGQRAGARI